MEEDDKDEAAEDGVRLWDLRALFEGVEDGVLCELFVELGVVVLSLVLNLNEDGVLLDSLSEIGRAHV